MLNAQPPSRLNMAQSNPGTMSHSTSHHPLGPSHQPPPTVAESPRMRSTPGPLQRSGLGPGLLTSTSPVTPLGAHSSPGSGMGAALPTGLPGRGSGGGGTTTSSVGAGATSSASGGGTGVSSNAAPGPIPATTPLVVRQDHNGVQWIAFEYSRDRVKMEYQIRCDVEAVNVDSLSQEFKTDNCVYPRACCPKGEYRGNRLVYETECNAVGWALAQLNPPLRGKRGLIQRAVDSWRNSNQDPRLRSRRVRRMAKAGTRRAGQAVSTPHPGHALPTADATNSGTSTAGVVGSTGLARHRLSGSVPGPQLHNHHAHPEGGVATAGTTEDVTGMYHSFLGVRVPSPPTPDQSRRP